MFLRKQYNTITLLVKCTAWTVLINSAHIIEKQTALQTVPSASASYCNRYTENVELARFFKYCAGVYVPRTDEAIRRRDLGFESNPNE